MLQKLKGGTQYSTLCIRDWGVVVGAVGFEASGPPRFCPQL